MLPHGIKNVFASPKNRTSKDSTEYSFPTTAIESDVLFSNKQLLIYKRQLTFTRVSKVCDLLIIMRVARTTIITMNFGYGSFNLHRLKDQYKMVVR